MQDKHLPMHPVTILMYLFIWFYFLRNLVVDSILEGNFVYTYLPTRVLHVGPVGYLFHPYISLLEKAFYVYINVTDAVRAKNGPFPNV